MTTPPLIRRYLVALRALAVLTLVLGVAYPLVITGIARLVFPDADGSLLHHDGRTVGSALIGQKFTRPVTKDGRPERDADGTPVLAADPRYFQSRPSAAGNGYDPLSTSASNLGPDSSALVAAVRQRRAAAARLDGVAPTRVPADALTASGSGLDPQISPAYAREQIARVARERGLSRVRVASLVAAHTQGRTFGFLGEPRVNVLELNLALDAATAR